MQKEDLRLLRPFFFYVHLSYHQSNHLFWPPHIFTPQISFTKVVYLFGKSTAK